MVFKGSSIQHRVMGAANGHWKRAVLFAYLGRLQSLSCPVEVYLVV